MRREARRLGGAGVVVALVWAAPASAEPGTATLVVHRTAGATGCENDAQLRARVNRIAGRQAIVETSGILRLTIDFDLVPPRGFKAVLSVASSDGEAPRGKREVSDDGPNCHALDEALAVSLAVLLDDVPKSPPTSPGPPISFAPPPENDEEPPPPPPRELIELPPLPPAERPHPRATFDASAITSAGLVGTSTFGFELQFAVRATHPKPKGFAPYMTIGGGFLGLIDDVEHTAGGEIHLQLVAAEVPACFAFQVANRSIGAAFCGFTALGAMIADGRGFTSNGTAAQPWFAFGASAIADGAIAGPLSFTGRLALFVPAFRPDFVLLDLDQFGNPPHTVFEPAPAGVFAGVGLRALIP